MNVDDIGTAIALVAAFCFFLAFGEALIDWWINR